MMFINCYNERRKKKGRSAYLTAKCFWKLEKIYF
jgi:hypothetical protein